MPDLESSLLSCAGERRHFLLGQVIHHPAVHDDKAGQEKDYRHRPPRETGLVASLFPSMATTTTIALLQAPQRCRWPAEFRQLAPGISHFSWAST